MQIDEQILTEYSTIIEKFQITEKVKMMHQISWQQWWSQIHMDYYQKSIFADAQEKNIVTDLFFGFCLTEMNSLQHIETKLWDIIICWYQQRLLPMYCGGLSLKERLPLLYICLIIRNRILEQIQKNNGVMNLDQTQKSIILSIWRQIFFNPFSPLNLYTKPTPEESLTSLLSESTANTLLQASILFPFSADKFGNIEETIASDKLELLEKAILAHWLINVPQTNIQEEHRDKFYQRLSNLFAIISSNLAFEASNYFIAFVEDLKAAFWRLSYIDGNNVEPLSVFGNYISKMMSKYQASRSSETCEISSKIRIGYISSYFGEHAVSYYMAKRILCHNRSRFEVYIYALGNRDDTITDKIKKNCDAFYKIDDVMNIKQIADKVIHSNLDILIYPDIGLDTATYLLAGMQLAKVQCAMAGHGTTTGLPTIQYYLSGDFEVSEAQSHYRETLIMLPCLGAAQLFPDTPKIIPTRKELKIPDKAIVFISCANGIKHLPSRDKLLMRILQKIPEAYIVLKPFPAPNMIDPVFMQRLRSIAQKENVQDRLYILPPLKQSHSVLGLLSLADIQLDTYPYNGWTTNMEALYMGLPVVTQEGQMARSRWGAAMLRSLGINEGIALNDNQYVEWAVRLAKNYKLRSIVKNKILEKAKTVLFNDGDFQAEYENILIKISQNKYPSV